MVSSWTVTGPQQAIDAPRIEKPATGLVSLARQPEMPDNRWELGYQYRPETPPGHAQVRSNGHNYSQGTDLGGTNTASTRVHVVPVTLTVELSDTSFTEKVLNLPDRATRALEASTSRLLAHEFWTGEIAQADGLPNPYLQGLATDVTSKYTGPVDPETAVAALVQELSNAGMGDAMIHVAPYVGVKTQAAWRNEWTLQDHGFVVVADHGYPGTGPAGSGGPYWAYATEIVNVRLGPIEVVPMDVRETIDKTTNTVTYRAQRMAAVDFAGPVIAIQVTP